VDRSSRKRRGKRDAPRARPQPSPACRDGHGAEALAGKAAMDIGLLRLLVEHLTGKWAISMTWRLTNATERPALPIFSHNMAVFASGRLKSVLPLARHGK